MAWGNVEEECDGHRYFAMEPSSQVENTKYDPRANEFVVIIKSTYHEICEKCGHVRNVGDDYETRRYDKS